MIAAMIVACGLWAISWCLGNRMASAWGVLLPCALMPLIDLDMMQLRTLILIAMLATLAMLFSSHLRHYLLLPSCMALVGGLTAISLHFNFN